MPKRTDHGIALFDRLDHLLQVRRHLESENLAAQRMQMSCGHVETPFGAVPMILQTPYPGIVQSCPERERGVFAQFAGETTWPGKDFALLGSIEEVLDVPVVCLSGAFCEAVLHPGRCVLTVGTRGKPGWTNQNTFEPAAFEYLQSMPGTGGVLVNFASSLEASFPAQEPTTERGISWMDIRREEVGEGALALVKRPRERLILLLAIHLDMSPAEINKLNLSQVTQKLGRDYRLRVYLKKRLVRKKVVADALAQFRKRESFWDPKEPLLRTGKTAPSGRSMRMGTRAIEACIVRYAERALKAMPAVSTAKEPPALPARPPLFWISNIKYHRA